MWEWLAWRILRTGEPGGQAGTGVDVRACPGLWFPAGLLASAGPRGPSSMALASLLSGSSGAGLPEPRQDLLLSFA